MIKEKEQAEKNLIDSFARWEHLYTYGGSDPFWEDGCNLNLVRNHIIYNKKKLEGLKYFPEIYYRETPTEVDNRYMARVDEIREHAKKSFAIYTADKNFQYLQKNASRLNEKQAEKICLSNVLGYAYGLETFIKSDSLVEMRRHENPERYLESFKSCREKMEEILEKGRNEKQLVIVEEQTGQLRFV